MQNKEQLQEVSWHNVSVDKAVTFLGTDRKKGISNEEVVFRRENYGVNKIKKSNKFSLLKIFLSQFNSPLIYLLFSASVLTFLIGEKTDSIVIGLSIFFNGAFGFWEEFKVSKVFNKLNSVLKTSATVIRDGKKREILQEEIVVGDLVSLRAGDKIPADGRVVDSESLQVSEAILTGESNTSFKITKKISLDTHLADRENMVFKGSLVEGGRGLMIVTAVGDYSEIGSIASLIEEAKETKSPLQKKIAKLGKFIGFIIIVLVLVLIFTGIAKGEDVFEIFESAVAIAIGGVPESLPIVVTVILAIGMERLFRKKGLVRKMNSVETLGAASIICLDKTKTLTQGKMELAKLITDDKKEVIKAGIICNEAYIENPEKNKKDWIINGSPTDKALFLMGSDKGIYRSNFKGKYQEIMKFSFDYYHKFQAILIKENKKYFIYIAGAPDRLLSFTENKKDWEEKTKALASEGLRVIGLAKKEVKNIPQNQEEFIKTIKDINFIGLAGFKDPIRKEIKKSIKKAVNAGITPIIITGDQAKTALYIAEEAGLSVQPTEVLEGRDLDGMSESQLKKTVHNFKIYVRSEPRHKIRIVNAWQKNGRVVAMVGDGVNDAPAIKKADIGIAVGSGTEIAKEASDLVLLNDSFDIIIEAIAEGRTILNNLRKSIAYILSDSFASIIIVGISKVIFGWPLPILPVQILWNNFIEDTFPTIAYAFEPPEKGAMSKKALEVNKKLLTQEMKFLIFFVGIIEQFILLAFFWILWEKLRWDIDYVRTLMFGFFAIDTAFVVYAFKDLNKNIWQIDLFNNKMLNGASVFVVLAFLATIYIPTLRDLIKTVVIDVKGWMILSIVIFINIFMIEATKFFFIKMKKRKKRVL